MSTGPQTLLAPIGDDGDPDVTHIDLAEVVYRHAVIAPAIASLTAPAPAAHQHRTPGLRARLRGLFQGHADVPEPPSQLLTDGPGEFTQAVSNWQSPSPWPAGALDRDVPEVAHEHADPEPTMALHPAELADDLITDAPPTARPFAPQDISHIPWAMWDTAANRQPMQPDWTRHVAEELTNLPVFRDTLAMSTRDHAAECLCGDEMDGQAWGERMVSAGVHLLTATDLWVVRMLTGVPLADGETQRDGVAA